MNHDRIIDQYSKGASIAQLAKSYELPKEEIRVIVKSWKDEENEYRKWLFKQQRYLPNNNDREADKKWQAAFNEGRI